MSVLIVVSVLNSMIIPIHCHRAPNAPIQLLINPNYKIPTNKLIKILDKLSVAYKDISEEEQKSIINNVYDDLFNK